MVCKKMVKQSHHISTSTHKGQINFCQQKNVFDEINLQETVDVNNLISQLINAIFKN